MRILVTGGAGFIGSHIADHYVAAGHEVAIIDNLWTRAEEKEVNLNPQAQFYYEDITHEVQLAQNLSTNLSRKIVNHHAACYLHKRSKARCSCQCAWSA